MMSFLCLLVYLLLLALCFIFEIKRNKKWNNTTYPKSRLDSKGISTIYYISLAFMTFFMIINLIIEESIELCVSTTIIALLILFIAFFSSKISIVITNNEIIKYNFFGETIIKITEIITIDDGCFIKIKAKENMIQLETKFYDSGIVEVKHYLNEIKANKMC